MSTGFTTITAANIQDASGRKLASGRAIFFPVTRTQKLPGYNIGGAGVGICRGVSFIVENGAITGDLFGDAAKLADALQVDSPDEFGYRLHILDETGAEVQGLGFEFLQPFGTTWSLDSYVPGVGSGSDGGGSGDDTPTLVFAAPDTSLWRLARVSGALTAVAYSGSLAAEHLYLNDVEVEGNVFEVTVENGGQIDWDLVTGHTGIDSVTLTDDDTETEATFSIASGAEQWT